jgi:hypothetical protein
MHLASGKRTTHIPTTREALVRIRLKALRCGFWFNKLSRDERNFMELVIKVTNRVRSFLLTKLLSCIVKKLLDALKGEVAWLRESVGISLAQKLSGFAQGWGNRSATKWSEDPGFIKYLTIMYLNRHNKCSQTDP